MIDSHCHLDDPRFDEDRDEMLGRAVDAGVDRFVTIGCWGTAVERERCVALARSNDRIWATVGVHPHDVATMDDDSFEHVRNLATTEARVVGIGETGLDYHYDHSPRELQQEWFRRYLRLGVELDLPVVVHTRNADEDTARILQEEATPGLRGVIHCFSSGIELARTALSLGWHLGFTGIVTFNAGQNVRDAVAITPMDQLLVETDAPYLAPVPKRGKRNEPAFLPHTVDRIAEVKGLEASDVIAASVRNTEALFGLPHS